jgi:hypothetical protein
MKQKGYPPVGVSCFEGSYFCAVKTEKHSFGFHSEKQKAIYAMMAA